MPVVSESSFQKQRDIIFTHSHCHFYFLNKNFGKQRESMISAKDGVSLIVNYYMFLVGVDF
jgi:hypothetical protein